MLDAVLLCLVVGISDGDTLKARCGEAGHYEQVTIRLAEIDAPEKRQAFGARSKVSLSALCFSRWATISTAATDRYGRRVARVKCQGKDASAEQVRAGMAWAYTKYLTDPEIARLEESARAAGVGLWNDSQTPLAPWEWRKARRAESSKASSF